MCQKNQNKGSYKIGGKKYERKKAIFICIYNLLLTH